MLFRCTADRVGALARRPPIVPTTTLAVGDLEMDLLARTVTRAGKRIELLAQEFKILEYLMRHAGQVVTRTMLLEGVWDYHFDPQTNVVDVVMSRLRAKIDPDHRRIETVLSLLQRYGVLEDEHDLTDLELQGDLPAELRNAEARGSKLLNDQKRLYALVQYIRSEDRRQFLREYFGTTG